MPAPSTAPPDRPRPTAGFVLRSALSPVLLGGLLFGTAGRVDWLAAWICLAVFVASAAAVSLYVWRVNPAVLAARAQKPRFEQRWDRLWVALYAPLPLVMLAVAGLDVGRAAPTPAWAAVAAGAGAIVAGCAVVGWAMGVNRTLFVTVRVERERGHAVEQRGPYRFVRHPYYLGLVLVIVGVAVGLGSLYAAIPGGLAAVLVAIRAHLEDRLLQRELAGYADYARRVRWRLVPGLW